jgi:hypothetical protein
MFIYMFKLYQLTQAICYDSYTAAINSISATFAMYILAFSLFYALIMLLWMVSVPA